MKVIMVTKRSKYPSKILHVFNIWHVSTFQVHVPTQCQMLLDVQLLGFENKNNLETRNYGGIEYCCCEGGNSKCSEEKTAPNLQECPPTCDVFFNMKISDCQYPSGCSITTINEPIIDSPSVSDIGYSFSFIVKKKHFQVSHCSICTPIYIYILLSFSEKFHTKGAWQVSDKT